MAGCSKGLRRDWSLGPRWNGRLRRQRHLWGSWQLWGGRQVVEFCLYQLVHAAKARAVPGGMCCIPTVEAPIRVLSVKVDRAHQLRISEETEGTNCLSDMLLSCGEGCCRCHGLVWCTVRRG
eukprot:8067355-Ditylum_brightwellii.AAC.2